MPILPLIQYDWNVTGPHSTKIGDVTVSLINQNNGKEVGVKADFRFDTSLKAQPGQTRLETAAHLLGGDHFNWYHVCIVDSNPTNDWIGNETRIPYIDPPAYGFGPTAVWEDDVQWADCRPWYFDETRPPIEKTEHGIPIYKYHYNADENYIGNVSDVNSGVSFIDHPKIDRGHHIEFKGWLICVKKDGTPASWLGGFGWTSATDMKGVTRAELTAQLTGDPPKHLYDDLIGANPLMWNTEPVEIDYNLIKTDQPIS